MSKKCSENVPGHKPVKRHVHETSQKCQKNVRGHFGDMFWTYWLPQALQRGAAASPQPPVKGWRALKMSKTCLKNVPKMSSDIFGTFFWHFVDMSFDRFLTWDIFWTLFRHFIQTSPKGALRHFKGNPDSAAYTGHAHCKSKQKLQYGAKAENTCGDKCWKD